MFMLVNKGPYYISCENEVEMWVLEEKKSIFLNSHIESYSRPIRRNKEKYS